MTVDALPTGRPKPVVSTCTLTDVQLRPRLCMVVVALDSAAARARGAVRAMEACRDASRAAASTAAVATTIRPAASASSRTSTIAGTAIIASTVAPPRSLMVTPGW